MRAFRLGAMLFLGIFGLAFFGFGVFSIVRSEWLTAVVAVAIAVFWGAAVMKWAVMPKSTPFATADGSGTTIRPDRRIDRYMLLGMVTGIVGCGGLGVFGTLGWLRLPLPDATDIVRMMSIPWGAVAVVRVVALWVTLRRGSFIRVRLTPEGFEFAERFKTRRGEWANVVDVSNEAPDVPKATSPLVVSLADGSTIMLMESALLGPRDGVYTLMHYLWRHPDARTELIDGRAVTRLLAI